MEYLDFEVEITAAAGGLVDVRVLRSPAGEARTSVRFPFDSITLENRLQALQIALLRSAGTRRRIETPEAKTVQRFGQELWQSLFTDEILGRLEASRNVARQRKMGLRIKLRTSDAAIAALPWEFLYDEGRGDFLTLSTSTPLVRYIPIPQVMEPLAVRLPLRMLAMVVTIEELDELDVNRERKRLEQAIRPLRERGLIELQWLQGQTRRDLQRALRGDNTWHIFHFVGHGGFDANSGEGVVMVADERGKQERLSARDLGRLLGDHDPLRLAVLNACETAKADEVDVFSSTASTLVQRGTPAVVAMQYEITDDAAIEFSRSFYEAIADGMPVDASLAEARKSVALQIPNTLEWGTPVLFMRAEDGVLFKLGRGRRPGPGRAAPAAVGAVAPGAAPPTVPAAVRPGVAQTPSDTPAPDTTEADPVTTTGPTADTTTTAQPPIAPDSSRERPSTGPKTAAPWAAAEATTDIPAVASWTDAHEPRAGAEAPAIDAAAARRGEPADAAPAAPSRLEPRDRGNVRSTRASRAREAWPPPATTEPVASRAEDDLGWHPAAPRVRGLREAPTSAPVLEPDVTPPRGRARGRRDSAGRGVAAILAIALAVLVLALFRLPSDDGGVGGTTARPTSTREARTSAATRGQTTRPELAVPDVYNMSAQDGVDAIRAAGFTHVRQVEVCSGSVDAGRVREVVLDDGSPARTETEIVTENGPIGEWATSTPLVVKISTGVPCN